MLPRKRSRDRIMGEGWQLQEGVALAALVDEMCMQIRIPSSYMIAEADEYKFWKLIE
jgi:hypothetical protein